MQKYTYSWLIFVLGLFTVMSLLVSYKNIKKLFPFGFLMGFVQAIIINWPAIYLFRLWRLPGEVFVGNVPIFVSLSWIPPTIIFANFFPAAKGLIIKAVYILIFASGTGVIQLLQGLIGIWESLRWNFVRTFFMALVTHTIMSLFLPVFGVKSLQKNK